MEIFRCSASNSVTVSRTSVLTLVDLWFRRKIHFPSFFFFKKKKRNPPHRKRRESCLPANKQQSVSGEDRHDLRFKLSHYVLYIPLLLLLREFEITYALPIKEQQKKTKMQSSKQTGKKTRGKKKSKSKRVWHQMRSMVSFALRNMTRSSRRIHSTLKNSLLQCPLFQLQPPSCWRRRGN